MSDDSSIFEDLERYRRNNVELAIALNDLKAELNVVQMQLLEKNRELQNVYDENAALKKNVDQKDAEMSKMRASIVELVTTNTNKYREMMAKIGLVPNANGSTKPAEQTTVASEKRQIASTEQSNGRVNIHRRQRRDGSDDRLADLTEESINSQLNDSKSVPTSPEPNAGNHVTSRRRMSMPPMTPPAPLRVIQDRVNQERLIANGETKPKKSTAKVQKLEKIVDENAAPATNGRSKRSAAPKNLSEPKLGTKLRRN